MLFSQIFSFWFVRLDANAQTPFRPVLASSRQGQAQAQSRLHLQLNSSALTSTPVPHGLLVCGYSTSFVFSRGSLNSSLSAPGFARTTIRPWQVPQAAGSPAPTRPAIRGQSLLRCWSATIPFLDMTPSSHSACMRARLIVCLAEQRRYKDPHMHRMIDVITDCTLMHYYSRARRQTIQISPRPQ